MAERVVEAAVDEPRTGALVLAFAAIYLIWGSTYLAIRFAIETLPPFLMLFGRFFTAGLLMYAFLRFRGLPRPTPREWAGSAVVGALLLFGGTGAVAWSEQWIPSGLAALIVAIVPVWMVLLDWVGPARHRPRPAVGFGLVLGLGGVAVLVGPVDLSGDGRMLLAGSVAVVFGTLSWAVGSVYGKHLPHPRSPWVAAATQMVTGGVLLAIAGTIAGEWSRVSLAAISVRSILALAYLIVFGSLAAFGAYVYLLRHAAPARVGSYAYVNPVVAVFLGWALADEPVTARTLLAAAIILTGVILIVTKRRARKPAEPAHREPGPFDSKPDAPLPPCTAS